MSVVELGSEPPRPSAAPAEQHHEEVKLEPEHKSQDIRPAENYWNKYFQYVVDKVRGRAYKYNFVERNQKAHHLSKSNYFKSLWILPEKFHEEELKHIHKPGPSKVDSPQGILTSFVGAFIGISLCGYLNYIGAQKDNPAFPVQFLALSFGAASVLLFGKPHAEFSAVRNVIGGQVLSALTGCTWRAIFHAAFDGHESAWLWLCGGLSVATAICIMHATKTIFPPGGATALTAATIPTMLQWYGYFFVIQPIFTGTIILFSVAMVVNNILPERFYPLFWK
jgi:CBS domain-containing membrane protein